MFTVEGRRVVDVSQLKVQYFLRIELKLNRTFIFRSFINKITLITVNEQVKLSGYQSESDKVPKLIDLFNLNNEFRGHKLVIATKLLSKCRIVIESNRVSF